MKKILTSALAIASLSVLAGCGEKAENTEPAAQNTAPAAAPAANVVVAFPKGSVKPGDQAVCVVCNKNGGGTEKEAVAATLDYKGKTYAFCNESEKAEFISNTAKYAQAP